MSRPSLPEGPVFAKGPYRVCHLTHSIMGESAFGGPCKIADIRGWGYLTGHGQALALSPEEAITAQRKALDFIVAAMNAAAGYDAPECPEEAGA